MKPVGFKGRRYSPEDQHEFETYHPIAKIEKDSLKPNQLRRLIDNLEITDWFKDKYREFQKEIGMNIKPKQEDRGFKLQFQSKFKTNQRR